MMFFRFLNNYNKKTLTINCLDDYLDCYVTFLYYTGI